MSLDLKNIDQTKEFKQLVTHRWTIAIILTALVFITYYGFILVVGISKATMAQKIGVVTTLGIPVAIAVIIISFFLTAFYVIWANSIYDSLAASILKKVKGK